MDKNVEAVQELRIQRTVKALCANNYDAHFIPDEGALLQKLAEYLPQGASCSVGGSITLFETGVIDYIKGRGDLDYLDRYAEGADVFDLFRRALSCDVYLTSTNAVTEQGELYNVDGNGNRVAALIYGPQKVVVVAGANKIVQDVEQARQRVKEIAAPANNIRLETPNPCVRTGRCVNCRAQTTSCCTEVVSRIQRIKDRVAVLILPMALGY